MSVCDPPMAPAFYAWRGRVIWTGDGDVPGLLRGAFAENDNRERRLLSYPVV